MIRFTSKRTISAPIDLVFKTVADINNFSKARTNIAKIEFLSEIRSGVGARFKETRLMNGKESVTELEVTEFTEGQHIRFIADSHGTIWDSTFTVKSIDEKTELELTMDAKASNLMANMMNKMIKGMVEKALEKDMDAVKAYCEK